MPEIVWAADMAYIPILIPADKTFLGDAAGGPGANELPIPVVRFDAAADEEAYFFTKIEDYGGGDLTFTYTYFSDGEAVRRAE